MNKVNKITALIMLVLVSAVVVLSINLVNCYTANKQLKKVISIQANQLDEKDSVFYNYNVSVK
jgi:hypothetical protein|nr:MAG TPA: hypothetical protein [Caudoviricetes sp.]